MIDLYMFKTVKGEIIYLDVNKIIDVSKSFDDNFVIQYGLNKCVVLDLQEFLKLAKVVNFIDPEPLDITRDFERIKREAFVDMTLDILKKYGDKQRTKDTK